jgi:hypothetical protein
MPSRLQFLATLLILCTPAVCQQKSTILQGGWSATAGPSLFHGKWTALVSPRRPNSARGSWILVNDRGDVLMQGTWSGQKSATGWKGTFSARVLRGGVYSGVWSASGPGPGSKTFADMLQAAAKSAASGAWRSGGYGGAWRLSPSP